MAMAPEAREGMVQLESTQLIHLLDTSCLVISIASC